MPRIRHPRRDELEALREIERQAGRAYADVGMEEIARDEPPGLGTLERHRSAGGAWVADEDGRPVAYLIAGPLGRALHVDQVSVAPSHARRGIGAALIEHLAETARAGGRTALTLTTFRDVPWNAPYYERLGFETVEPEGELAALVARESAAIPSDAPRVAMRRALDPIAPEHRAFAERVLDARLADPMPTFRNLSAATGVPVDGLVHLALVRWASAGAEALLSIEPQVLDDLLEARGREDWAAVAGILDWLAAGR